MTVGLRGTKGNNRRAGIIGANANAALWAVGNGLVSSTLVVYLALDLGAAGLAISLILAAPRFAGVMRLGVPALIAALGCRKLVCIVSYAASTLVLLLVPAVTLPQLRDSPGAGIALLILAWCIYHLLEYVGGVALWSWLGDIMPRRIRGRLLGRREQWKVGGRTVGMAISFGLAICWRWLLPDAARWQPLALSATAGAALMLAAIVPLICMPAFSHCPSAIPQAPFRSLLKVFRDRRYRRLLLASCWFSAINGITAAAQGMYPLRVLGISYEGILGFRGLMRGGQMLIAPMTGRLVDRFGSRPVMVVSQLIVASSPLFFLLATAEYWWILAGAYISWIAYAGLNVGLDNIKFKLAAEENNAPYLAAYHAISDLANGVATVIGGLFYDILRGGEQDAMRIYAGLFVVGLVGRSLAALFWASLIEPDARHLWERLWRRAE